jgi:hypothetical protein
MQIVCVKVDNAAAATVENVCVPYIPFRWNYPVIGRGAGRNFVNVKRDNLLKICKRLPYSISRKTSAQRIEPLHECVAFPSDAIRLVQKSRLKFPSYAWTRRDISRGTRHFLCFPG